MELGAIDLIMKLWPILMGGIGLIVWLVRLEGKLKAADHSINGLKQESSEQWRFITEDRGQIGMIKEVHVGLRKDVDHAQQTADRLETSLNKHIENRTGTVDRIWSRIEDIDKKTSTQIAEIKARAPR